MCHRRLPLPKILTFPTSIPVARLALSCAPEADSWCLPQLFYPLLFLFVISHLNLELTVNSASLAPLPPCMVHTAVPSFCVGPKDPDSGPVTCHRGKHFPGAFSPALRHLKLKNSSKTSFLIKFLFLL